MLLVGGALCNDAQLVEEAAPGHFHTLGDPTEGALLAAAARLGFRKGHLEKTIPRVAELPFDSERKRMTTVHRTQDLASNQLSLGLSIGTWPYLAFTKGSVDGLLDISTQVLVDGQIKPLTPDWRQRVQNANQGLARKGMRVLGTAFRPLESLPIEGPSLSPGVESELVFVGLFGMIDPPRGEVKDAVQTCKAAGIRPVMITGDHPLTALQIAGDLGISESGRALTGLELQEMSAEELEDTVEHVSVYARVSPEHKLKIVQALQNKGHIVAMTGDGVNDAPALKKADIGVAMGITGTDVAKEAADMVLLDDNFATIVAAVEEGRVIYDNIRKFVKYSVAGNIGKVLVMLLAPFLGKPLPLLPLQLLWLNLLTDGLMGLGLGLEPPEPETMNRNPYSPKEKIFSRGAGTQVAWVGLLIGIIALAVGTWYYYTGRETWQTMIFTTLAFSQVWQALAARSQQSTFSIGLFSNPLLTGLVAFVFVLQVTVIYVPFLGKVFQTVPLTVADFAVSLVVGSLVFIGMESTKRCGGRRPPRGAGTLGRP